MLVNWIRSVKSPQEIEVMKQAGEIITKVMTVAIEQTAAGVRECDIASAILQAQVSGTAKFGGDYPSIYPLLFQGEKTSTPHLNWTDDQIQNETAVSYELAGCRHRYHTPMARSVYIGSSPPKNLTDTADIVNEGINEVLDYIQPGRTCEEVELVWRKVISKYDLSKESRMGYPIGLAYPPVWCENTMSMRPGDRTILRANMTFHVLVAMWMEGWGYSVSEPIRVTETGCESFANVSRKLFIKN